jgi:hypothetical protein
MKFTMTKTMRRCWVGEIRIVDLLARSGIVACLALAAVACGGDDAPAGGGGNAGAAGNSDIDQRCVKSNCPEDLTYLDKYDCATYFDDGACIPELQAQLACYKSHATCDSSGSVLPSSVASCKAAADTTIACLNAAGGMGG